MRTYDKEFKINAVNLYKSSGQPLKTIAQELGIGKSTLSGWVYGYSKYNNESFPGKGHVRPSEEEIKALHKELIHLRQERDILKKALAIFSGPQGKGISL
jgi:transposase-like protein